MAEPELRPPCDVASERALLGALIIKPDVILKIETPLEPGEFYEARNGKLYRILSDLGDRADVLTISSRAREAGLDWTEAEITRLTAETPTYTHAPDYAAAIRNAAIRRRLYYAGPEITKLAHDCANEADEVRGAWERARQLVDKAIGQESGGDVLPLRESLVWYLALLSQREEEAQSKKPVLAFPWQALTQYVPRLRPGTLATLAAGTGVGKTTFLENCAERWVEDGFGVLFFHYELAPSIMLDRRLSRASGVAIERLEKGEKPEEVDAAIDQIAKDWKGELVLVHSPGWTAARMALKAKQLASRNQVDVICCDYLQKFAYTESIRGLTPAQLRGQDVELMKNLAEETGAVVLLASQLNREALGQRKRMDFIRDTGELAEKSNLVITLDRPVLEKDLYDTSGKLIGRAGELSPIVTARIDKNTTGPTGEATLFLNGSTFLITDVAR